MTDLKARQQIIAKSEDGHDELSNRAASPQRVKDGVDTRSELRGRVRDLLLADDPVNINYGGGVEAYAPDINAIVERLSKCRNAQDVCSMIFDELCQSFGPEAVGSREHYLGIAKRLWELHATSH